MSSEHKNPWWIGAPSQYEELRPEVVKLCQEWRDEDGDPSHLADWLFAMLDVAVKRTERDTAAVIHARYEALAAECMDAPDRDDESEEWQDGRDEALIDCAASIRRVAAS